MKDNSAWFALNVGRISCSDEGGYTYKAHHSRESALTSERVGDLSSVREELHHLLDRAIDYISRSQEKEKVFGLRNDSFQNPI